MIYDPILERIILHYTSGKYENEVLEAKLEFFEKMIPTTDENSELYELRMSQFLDWFLFTRKLKSKNVTPIQAAVQQHELAVTPTERPLYDNLLNVYHSLFEFLKAKGSDVYIYDLFTKKKIIIKNSHVTAGFNKDYFFDARLIPYNESFIFTRGFCFHPEEVKKYITSEAKKLKKSTQDEREMFMMKLNRMRAKVDQYKHIGANHIYTNESTFRV